MKGFLFSKRTDGTGGHHKKKYWSTFDEIFFLRRIETIDGILMEWYLGEPLTIIHGNIYKQNWTIINGLLCFFLDAFGILMMDSLVLGIN